MSSTSAAMSSENPLFDCRPMLRALRVRWRHPSFRKRVGIVLQTLEERRVQVPASWRRKFPTPPNEDDLDGLLAMSDDDDDLMVDESLLGPPRADGGDPGEVSVRSTSSSTTSTSGRHNPPLTVSSLQEMVLQAVDGVKAALPVNPWHKALKFVAYDLPLQRDDVQEWLVQLALRADYLELQEERAAVLRRWRAIPPSERSPPNEDDLFTPDQKANLENIAAQVLSSQEAVRSHILSQLPPSAHTSPQTDGFVDGMLMPLREFFVASVVCSLLTQISSVPRNGDVAEGHPSPSMRRDSSASALHLDSLSGSIREEGASLSRSPKKQPNTFPCHHHAALHAKDIAAVHQIESLTPHNPVALYQFVHDAVGKNTDYIIVGDGKGTPGTVARIDPRTTSMVDIAGCTTPGRLLEMLRRATSETGQKQAPSTTVGKRGSHAGIPYQSRYAQYHLIYLDDSLDWDDTTFIAAMMPLAECGLAHAQHDVGMCFLSLRERDEACSWLEKAARYGHSKAMLALARLHLSMAFEADATVAKLLSTAGAQTSTSQGGKDAASKVVPSAPLPVKLTANNGGAIGGFAKLGRDERVRQLTHYHVTKALSWLDSLLRANWDADTILKDIPDGNALRSTIERDALALIEARAQREKRRAQLITLSIRVSLMCLFAVALATVTAFLAGWLDGSRWDDYGGDSGLHGYSPRFTYRTLLDGIYQGKYTTDPTTGERISLFSSERNAEEELSGRFKPSGPSHVQPKEEATHVRRHY